MNPHQPEKRLERLTASFSDSEFRAIARAAANEDRSLGSMLRQMAVRYMRSVSALTADPCNDMRCEDVPHGDANCGSSARGEA
jgi:hypothetical protein